MAFRSGLAILYGPLLRSALQRVRQVLVLFQGFLSPVFFNNASAGEYAAFTLIAANAGYLQVAIITLIANARYLLMSCVRLLQRFAGHAVFSTVFIGYDN